MIKKLCKDQKETPRVGRQAIRLLITCAFSSIEGRLASGSMYPGSHASFDQRIVTQTYCLVNFDQLGKKLVRVLSSQFIPGIDARHFQ